MPFNLVLIFSHITRSYNQHLPVADPGFDLTGGVDFVNGGGGGVEIHQVLKDEVLQ